MNAHVSYVELEQWSPGRTGKAMVLGPGWVYSWATDDKGYPNHWVVANKEGIGNFIAIQLDPDGGASVLFGDPDAVDDVIKKLPGTYIKSRGPHADMPEPGTTNHAPGSIWDFNASATESAPAALGEGANEAGHLLAKEIGGHYKNEDGYFFGKTANGLPPWSKGQYGKAIYFHKSGEVINWATDENKAMDNGEMIVDGYPTHSDVLNGLLEHHDYDDCSPLVIDPNGVVSTLDVDADKQYGFKEKAEQAVAKAIGGTVAGGGGHGWYFGKTAATHKLDWIGGAPGKGVVLPDGSVHTWWTNDGGFPHHADYLHKLGELPNGLDLHKEFNEEMYDRSRSEFWPFHISGDGRYNYTWDTQKNQPPVHPHEVDPHLEPPEDQNMWSFGSTSGTQWNHVVKSDFDPEYTFFKNTDGWSVPDRSEYNVVVGHIPTGTIYVGPNGAHHADIINHHRLADVDPDYPEAFASVDAEFQDDMYYGMIDRRGYQAWGPGHEGIKEALHKHGLLDHADGSIHSSPSGEAEWHFGSSDMKLHDTEPEPHEIVDGSRIVTLKSGQWLTGMQHHHKLIQAAGIPEDYIDKMGIKNYSSHTHPDGPYQWFTDDKNDMRKNWAFGATIPLPAVHEHEFDNEWHALGDDSDWGDRRPIVYDEDMDAVHVGPLNSTHHELSEIAIRAGHDLLVPHEQGRDGRGYVYHGWMGYNPEADADHAVVNHEKDNEFGWYTAPSHDRANQALQQHFNAQPEQKDVWDFTAARTASVVEVNHPIQYAHGPGRDRPYIHDGQTTYVGEQGAFHWDLISAVPALEEAYGKRGGAPKFLPGYSMGRVTQANDHVMVDDYDKKGDDLAPHFERHFGMPVDVKDPNVWNFDDATPESSFYSRTAAGPGWAEHTLPDPLQAWKPGTLGKGLTSPNGTAYTWTIDENHGQDGYPSHAQALKALGHGDEGGMNTFQNALDGGWGFHQLYHDGTHEILAQGEGKETAHHEMMAHHMPSEPRCAGCGEVAHPDEDGDYTCTHCRWDGNYTPRGRDEFHFGSVHHQINYDPKTDGDGKYIVEHDGTVHTWGNKPFDIHHFQYLNTLPGHEQRTWTNGAVDYDKFNVKDLGMINPKSGMITSHMFGEDEGPKLVQQHYPQFKAPSSDDMWSFAKTAHEWDFSGTPVEHGHKWIADSHGNVHALPFDTEDNYISHDDVEHDAGDALEGDWANWLTGVMTDTGSVHPYRSPYIMDRMDNIKDEDVVESLKQWHPGAHLGEGTAPNARWASVAHKLNWTQVAAAHGIEAEPQGEYHFGMRKQATYPVVVIDGKAHVGRPDEYHEDVYKRLGLTHTPNTKHVLTYEHPERGNHADWLGDSPTTEEAHAVDEATGVKWNHGGINPYEDEEWDFSQTGTWPEHTASATWDFSGQDDEAWHKWIYSPTHNEGRMHERAEANAFHIDLVYAGDSDDEKFDSAEVEYGVMNKQTGAYEIYDHMSPAPSVAEMGGTPTPAMHEWLKTHHPSAHHVEGYSEGARIASRPASLRSAEDDGEDTGGSKVGRQGDTPTPKSPHSLTPHSTPQTPTNAEDPLPTLSPPSTPRDSGACMREELRAFTSSLRHSSTPHTAAVNPVDLGLGLGPKAGETGLHVPAMSPGQLRDAVTTMDRDTEVALAPRSPLLASTSSPTERKADNRPSFREFPTFGSIREETSALGRARNLLYHNRQQNGSKTGAATLGGSMENFEVPEGCTAPVEGQPWKGVVRKDGARYHWAIDPRTEGPHHGDVLQQTAPADGYVPGKEFFYGKTYPENDFDKPFSAADWKFGQRDLGSPAQESGTSFASAGKISGVVQHGDTGFSAMPSEHSPVVYDPKTDTTHVGEYGTHHGDVIHSADLYDENEEPREDLTYGYHRDDYYGPFFGPDHARAAEQLGLPLGDGSVADDEWNFSSARMGGSMKTPQGDPGSPEPKSGTFFASAGDFSRGFIIKGAGGLPEGEPGHNWQPGAPGRGLITPEGEFHSWNPEVAHWQYVNHHGLDPASQRLHITHDGIAEGWDLTPEHEALIEAHGLRAQDTGEVWKFGSNEGAPKVVDWSSEGAEGHHGTDDHPWVYVPDTHTVHVGPKNAYHNEFLTEHLEPEGIDGWGKGVMHGRTGDHFMGMNHARPLRNQIREALEGGGFGSDDSSWHFASAEDEYHNPEWTEHPDGGYYPPSKFMGKLEPGKWGKAMAHRETGEVTAWNTDGKGGPHHSAQARHKYGLGFHGIIPWLIEPDGRWHLADEVPQEWRFAAAQHKITTRPVHAVPNLPGALPWKPGYHGKGYVAPDGTSYAWDMDEFHSGKIHHDNLIETLPEHPDNWQLGRCIYIDPSGELENGSPTHQEVMLKDPRMKLKAHDDWRF